MYRVNTSKLLSIATNPKKQQKISISSFIYFSSLKAITKLGYANAKIFVDKQGLMRLLLDLLTILQSY